MSILGMIFLIALGMFILGIIGFNLSKRHSNLEEACACVIAATIMIMVGCLIIGTIAPQRADQEIQTPHTITKTTNGYTIVSYYGIVTITDKAPIYLEPDSNIVIKATQTYNHWGWKLAPVSYKIAIEK